MPARRTLGIALVVAVLGAAAGITGWLLGGAADSEAPPAAAPLTAELGPARATVDAAWARSSRPAAAEGLDPAATATFDPLPGLTVSAVLTVAPARDSTLLPAALAERLRDAPPEPAPARLAGLAGWRYADMATTRPGVTLDVTVVPTSAGVLALACSGPRSLWNVAGDCIGGVRGIALRDARALQPDPHLALRLGLPAVLPRLDRRRVEGRKALRDAGSARGQARAARGLAGAHQRAAGALAPLAAPGGDSAELVAALGRSADAYAGLARAAQRRRPPAYARSRAAVRAAEARLAAALAAVG